MLIGGGGADILSGGAGEDVFRFTNLVDSSTAAPDWIMGFDGAGNHAPAVIEDQIDLQALDANTLVAGNQAFSFNGTTAGGAGTVWMQNVGADTWLRINVDGDADPEMSVRITDGATLASAYTAGDFLL